MRPGDLAVRAAEVGLSPLKAKRAAADLVTNEMWIEMAGGWAFHNWTDFNPTRSQQDTDAKLEKERKAVHRDTVLKAAVLLRDAGRCCFCDEIVSFSDRKGLLAGQYDHTIPLVKSGKTTLDNVRIICRFHNQTKAGKALHELPEWFPPLLEPYTHRHPVSEGLNMDLIPIQTASRVGSGRVDLDRDGPQRPSDLFGSIPSRPESRWLNAVPHPAQGA